jgi:hypothetical protein
MNKRGLRKIIVLLVMAGVVWAIVGCTAVSPTTAAISPQQQQAADNAVNWLISNHQNDDGGFSDFSMGANQAASGASGTLDTVLAMTAAGHDPAEGSSNPVSYLQDNPSVIADFASIGGGPAGKAILALAAADQNPRDFMGYNFVISLTAQISPTGQYNAVTAYDQSLALLALAAVDEPASDTAVQWLKDQQADNGSWDDGYGTADNPDATSMAVMALVAQGEPVDSVALTQATAFLADAQLDSGGWEYSTGFGENANSTALAVQALSALGEDFANRESAWAQGENAPLTALLNWQNSTGAFQADFGEGPFDDFFTTVQSIPATVGKAYPLP